MVSHPPDDSLYTPLAINLLYKMENSFDSEVKELPQMISIRKILKITTWI